MNQKFVIEEKIKEILFNEPEKLFNIEEIHTLLSEKYSEKNYNLSSLNWMIKITIFIIL